MQHTRRRGGRGGRGGIALRIWGKGAGAGRGAGGARLTCGKRVGVGSEGRGPTCLSCARTDSESWKKGGRRELEKRGAGVGDCVTIPLRVPVRVPGHSPRRRRDISATTRAAWSTTGRPGESKPLLSSPVDDHRTYSHPANKQTTPPRSRTSVILPQAASCALPASPVHHACKKNQLFPFTSGTRIAAALSPHSRTACSSHRRPVAVFLTPASSSPVVACLLAQHRHCPAGLGESALASP
jgi:hypothetical protein